MSELENETVTEAVEATETGGATLEGLDVLDGLDDDESDSIDGE